MSLVGGNLYTATDNAVNYARQNLKGNHQVTGDELLTIMAGSDKKKGMQFNVILDSTDGPPATYKSGVSYVVNAAEDDVIPLNDTLGHKHTGVSDGGEFIDVMLETVKNWWYCRPLTMVKEAFYQSASGGSFTNQQSGIDQYLDIDTNGTTNNYGNIHAANGFYTFGYGMLFSCDVKLTDTLTSYTARFGLNGELVQNTGDDKPKVIIEACPSCNGNNIRLVSADNTAGSRSANPKNSVDVANSRDIFFVRLYPGSVIDYISTSGLLQKTLDVPDAASGNSEPFRSFIAGIQTTTGTSRKMSIYMLDAVAKKASTSYR